MMEDKINKYFDSIKNEYLEYLHKQTTKNNFYIIKNIFEMITNKEMLLELSNLFIEPFISHIYKQTSNDEISPLVNTTPYPIMFLSNLQWKLAENNIIFCKFSCVCEDRVDIKYFFVDTSLPILKNKYVKTTICRIVNDHYYNSIDVFKKTNLKSCKLDHCKFIDILKALNNINNYYTVTNTSLFMYENDHDKKMFDYPIFEEFFKEQ